VADRQDAVARRGAPSIAHDGAERSVLYGYPRAGHFVHLEEAEAFTGDLLGFLGSKDPEPARIIDDALLARWRAARATR